MSDALKYYRMIAQARRDNNCTCDHCEIVRGKLRCKVVLDGKMVLYFWRYRHAKEFEACVDGIHFRQARMTGQNGLTI